MANFSPGPWHLSKSGSFVRDANGKNICDVTVFGGPPDEGEANGLLISASPELLAVVEKLLWHFPDLAEILGGQSQEEANELIRTAKEVFAKATTKPAPQEEPKKKGRRK